MILFYSFCMNVIKSGGKKGNLESEVFLYRIFDNKLQVVHLSVLLKYMTALAEYFTLKRLCSLK